MMISESFPDLRLRQRCPPFPESEELNLFWGHRPHKESVDSFGPFAQKDTRYRCTQNIPYSSGVCVCVAGRTTWVPKSPGFADPKLRTAARKDLPDGTECVRVWGEGAKSCGATCNLHFPAPPVTQATPSGSRARVAGLGSLFLQSARTLEAPSLSAPGC